MASTIHTGTSKHGLVVVDEQYSIRAIANVRHHPVEHSWQVSYEYIPVPYETCRHGVVPSAHIKTRLRHDAGYIQNVREEMD